MNLFDPDIRAFKTSHVLLVVDVVDLIRLVFFELTIILCGGRREREASLFSSPNDASIFCKSKMSWTCSVTASSLELILEEHGLHEERCAYIYIYMCGERCERYGILAHR